MISNLKNEIEKYLNNELTKLYQFDIKIVTEIPKDKEKGDIAVPTFSLLKALHKSPAEITPVIKDILLRHNSIDRVDIIGPYVNCFYNREFISKSVINSLEKNDRAKLNETICIDYSSPNIAKNFSIGHLRSSIIGESLGNIYEYLGAKVVRINHLGDFGTQFGKLIYAYLNWGDKDKIEVDPINELVKLYVDFHKKAEEDPSLDDKAREVFNELENGKLEYRELWEKFKTSSLKEFNRIYELLGVHFDEYSSEAETSRNANHVLSLLEDKKLIEIDDGASIVRIGDDIPPAIVRRTDGATLYITRDLEEIHRRYDKYHFDKMLYCVGNEQKLYFNQLKRVLNRMDVPFKDSVTHVNFGLILTGGKKMSTRTGNAVKLSDVLNESIALALNTLNEKNPNIKSKEEVAKAIGVSAIIFNDLKNYHENDYEFDLKEATRFDGLTGPYIQYTSVRIKSILEQSDYNKENIDYSLFNNDSMFDIIKLLDEFNDCVIKCANEYAPNYLAKHLLNLSSLFNSLYAKEKFLVDNLIERNTKLYILDLIKNQLDTGIKLLGMRIVDKM